MTENILIGKRVPKDFFITGGAGESDITVHAGSYHLALKEAGIEMYNIMSYSSILPKIANEIKKPSEVTHGAVMETISAASTSKKGERATAGIIFGWLYDKKTNEKYGGLVCEYNGSKSEVEAEEELKKSLNELYTNGYEENFNLREIKFTGKSLIPKKNFGTAIVALCFINYEIPILD